MNRLSERNQPPIAKGQHPRTLARRAMQWLLALAFILQAFLWWRAVWWFPQLPEKFPVHFNASGTPDGWSERGFMWFLLPILGLAIFCLFGVIMATIAPLARRSPGIVNMPKKDLWMKLSPEGRAATLAPTSAFLAFVIVLVELLFIFIMEGSGRVALGLATTLPPWPVFVFLALVFAALVPMYIATNNAVIARAQAEECA